MSIAILGSLGDWADGASLAGAVIALAGLGFVVVQLRGASAAARAQATIQFQQAFRESAEARKLLLVEFPVHESFLGPGEPDLQQRGDPVAFESWSVRGDLSAAHERAAKDVIKALNDVAQYVADGLSLRSALQQYHTIFVRAGFLLAPYIDERNRGKEVRWGVRVIELYNAGLRYHRAHPKHRAKRIELTRPGGALVLVDPSGRGLSQHDGYPIGSGASRRVIDQLAIRRATKGAERRLRQ